MTLLVWLRRQSLPRNCTSYTHQSRKLRSVYTHREVYTLQEKGVSEMKAFLFVSMLVMSIVLVSSPASARVSIHVNISLPPVLEFGTNPELVVIPGTYVYTVPDLDVDVFFYNGWWWRPWEGRWYRSRHYDSGWAYYRSVPTFYRTIPGDWRDRYNNHQWEGYQWNYQRIPEQQVRVNWKTWSDRRHWERQTMWGVQGYNPRTRQPHQQGGNYQGRNEGNRGQGRGRR